MVILKEKTVQKTCWKTQETKRTHVIGEMGDIFVLNWYQVHRMESLGDLCGSGQKRTVVAAAEIEEYFK
jgi:hypothetical protein